LNVGELLTDTFGVLGLIGQLSTIINTPLCTKKV
jgi:hypothetical protein